MPEPQDFLTFIQTDDWWTAVLKGAAAYGYGVLLGRWAQTSSPQILVFNSCTLQRSRSWLL
jgi:hypothetical protein